MDKPTGSYSSWENTMCNSLAPAREQTRLAWHDGYVSAKSEWHGLTDEEIDDIGCDFATLGGDIEGKNWFAFYLAIEAKLKEKNK